MACSANAPALEYAFYVANSEFCMTIANPPVTIDIAGIVAVITSANCQPLR